MYYYKYKFVSPDPLFAEIKEDLISYFDAGLVDDLMFPRWTKLCLQKLGRSSYPIIPTLLFIDAFEAKLPPDFIGVREAWLTTSICSPTFRKPGAFYQQITTQLDKPFDPCNPLVNCDPCNPDILVVTTKTTTDVTHPIRLSHLLVPGNITAQNLSDQVHGNQGVTPAWSFDHNTWQNIIPPHCESMGCLNLHASGPDTFDIRDGKFVTNFRIGDVVLIYYASHKDNDGYELIPENYRIQEFIKAYIRMKLFESIMHKPSDEGYQVSQAKFMLYKQMHDEAFVMADIEIKKKTVYERAYAIRRDMHRNDKYQRGLYNNYRRWGGRGLPSSSWGLND